MLTLVLTVPKLWQVITVCFSADVSLLIAIKLTVLIVVATLHLSVEQTDLWRQWQFGYIVYTVFALKKDTAIEK